VVSNVLDHKVRAAYICVLCAAGMVVGGLLYFGYWHSGIWAILSADVEYEFVVTDAATGAPIPDAEIVLEVLDDDDHPKSTILMTETDDSGRASYLKKNNFCEEHVKWGRQVSKSFSRSWCNKLTVAASGYQKFEGELSFMGYVRIGWSKEKGQDHLRFSIPLESRRP
jgi:hypothetical protein